MSKMSDNNKLAVQMLIAMVGGICAGLVFMMIRENVGADSSTWQLINSILFQDITAAGGEQAIGLFYILGQMFIRALQLVIVPMVFTSIVMAIGEIREASTLGRVAGKTIGFFLLTTTIALLTSGFIGLMFFKAGTFNVAIEGLEAAGGKTGSNPLKVILDIIPSNIGATMSVNNAVLAIVFLAVAVGLGMNQLNMGKDSIMYRFCEETSNIIVVFLNFAVNKFGPAAIFSCCAAPSQPTASTT